jgi:hypothetical protein
MKYMAAHKLMNIHMRKHLRLTLRPVHYMANMIRLGGSGLLTTAVLLDAVLLTIRLMTHIAHPWTGSMPQIPPVVCTVQQLHLSSLAGDAGTMIPAPTCMYLHELGPILCLCVQLQEDAVGHTLVVGHSGVTGPWRGINQGLRGALRTI